jgi:hypothetical protein
LSGEHHDGEAIATCKADGALSFAGGAKSETHVDVIPPLGHKTLRQWKSGGLAPLAGMAEAFPLQYGLAIVGSGPDPQSARVRLISSPVENGALGFRSDLTLPFHVV